MAHRRRDEFGMVEDIQDPISSKIELYHVESTVLSIGLTASLQHRAIQYLAACCDWQVCDRNIPSIDLAGHATRPLYIKRSFATKCIKLSNSIISGLYLKIKHATMIRGITRPTIFFDLAGLAHDGVVSVGRETDSTIRLDCPEVPFLLSRKHARIFVQPRGNIVLRDLSSTNGTYIAREGDNLRRLEPEEDWELKRGDMIGFGGPETIVARSETPDVTVANPFLFRYTPLDDDSDSANNSTAEPQAHVHTTGQARARKFSELEQRGQQVDMDCEEASTSSGDNECKKPKTAMTAKDIAAMLSNHLTCSICHDWLAGAHALSCGHMFCGVCLASWLTQKQSCPECRKPIAGVPIRCRNVDNSISDILGQNLVSPNSKRERRRKQLAWNEVGEGVLEAWTAAIQQRRQQAINAAAQHLSNLVGQPGVHAVTHQGPHMVPPVQHFRTSEHGAVGSSMRRANQGGAAPLNRQVR